MDFYKSDALLGILLIKVNGGGVPYLITKQLPLNLKSRHSFLFLSSIPFVRLSFTEVFSLHRSYFFQGTVSPFYFHYVENIYRVFSSLWRRDDLVRVLQTSFLI